MENKCTWAHNTQVLRWRPGFWHFILLWTTISWTTRCTLSNFEKSWAATQVGGPQWLTLLKSQRTGRKLPLPPSRRLQRKRMEQKKKMKKRRVPAERHLYTEPNSSSCKNIFSLNVIHNLPLRFLVITWLCPFILLLVLSMNKDTAPLCKVSNLWPLHRGHFDTITSVTAVSFWSSLTWQMGCMVTEKRSVVSVLVFAQIGLSEGEGGPVSRMRRRCTTVHQRLSSGPGTHNQIRTLL